MKKIALAIIACACTVMTVTAQEPALKNGELLTTDKQKAPTGWSMPKQSQPLKAITTNLPEGVKNGVEIDITEELKWDGFFCQYLKLSTPNNKYTLTGFAKSNVPGIAFFQVKLIKGKKAIKVINSKYSKTAWSKLSISYATQDADRMQILCRFKQKQQNIGQKVWFANLKLKKIATQISLVGDSTVCNYAENNVLRGWGQMLPNFFKEDVAITNNARGGRSTKTFIKEKRWVKTLADKPNFIFIQFGHNDSHAKGRPESTDANTDYKEYLCKYADDAKATGATAIFVTPMHRRVFKNGKISQALKPYADAMKAIAKEKGVTLVDLYALSEKVLTEKGEEGSTYLFKDKKDRTHFCEAGATLMAELVINDLKKQNHPITKYLK